MVEYSIQKEFSASFVHCIKFLPQFESDEASVEFKKFELFGKVIRRYVQLVTIFKAAGK